MNSWFLNTYCAVRDGIVSDAKDGFIWGGNRKPVAFSMLSGFEIKGIGRREWIHIIESRVCAYHAVRLTCVGSVVRLLRGHKLKSERAPRLGVRYDGKEHRSSESKKETARKVFISKLKAYDQPAYKLLDDRTHRLENAFPLPLSFEPYPASPPRDTTWN